MELIKLEKKRDDLKRDIDNISKDLYDTKDKMEDILIEAEDWTPWLRGQVLTFIEILDFKTSQMNDMQKSLDSVLKEIEGHKSEEKAKEAKAQKSQWKVIYNWSFPVGSIRQQRHEKIFDSLREAEESMEKMTSSYLNNLFYHCGKYSFSVSLEKIS